MQNKLDTSKNTNTIENWSFPKCKCHAKRKEKQQNQFHTKTSEQSCSTRKNYNVKNWTNKNDLTHHDQTQSDSPWVITPHVEKGRVVIMSHWTNHGRLPAVPSARWFTVFVKLQMHDPNFIHTWNQWKSCTSSRVELIQKRDIIQPAKVPPNVEHESVQTLNMRAFKPWPQECQKW